jgi:hypothetical protein
MTQRLTPKEREARIAAIVEARGDIGTAAESLSLAPKVLRGWVNYGGGRKLLPKKYKSSRNKRHPAGGFDIQAFTQVLGGGDKDAVIKEILGGYIQITEKILDHLARRQ